MFGDKDVTKIEFNNEFSDFWKKKTEWGWLCVLGRLVNYML